MSTIAQIRTTLARATHEEWLIVIGGMASVIFGVTGVAVIMGVVS